MRTMDPAVYARAHGVQSEASKVTVTRMACGELVYRRTVDSYRKDMQSKLTSLRREQKRLRRSVRDYRRKLKVSDRVHRKEKATILKPSQSPIHGGVDNALVDEKSATMKFENRLPPLGHPEEGEGHPRQDGFSLLNLHGVHEDRRHVAVPAGKGDRESRDRESILPQVRIVEEVGRKARKGSGKIGKASSKKRVVSMDEEDDEVFSLLSDSSDGEVDGRSEEEVIEVVSFRNGRLVRALPPLVKTNSSVYLKPVAVPEKLLEEETAVDNTPSCENTTGLVEKESIDGVPDEEDEHQSNIEGPRHPAQAASLPSIHQVIETSTESDPRHLGTMASEVESKPAHGLSQPKKQPTRKKATKGISFGDLIKFQHGSNTKRLFSLVDKLAEQSGIKSNSTKVARDKAMASVTDPRAKMADMRRARMTSESNPENLSPKLPTYGSVFYAMKFGYAQDTDDADVGSTFASGDHGLNPTLNDRSSYRSSHSFGLSTFEDDRSDRPSFLDNRSTRTALTDDEHFPHDSLSAIFPSLSLKGTHHLRSKAILSDPGRHPLSRLSIDHKARTDLSTLIDIASETNGPAQSDTFRQGKRKSTDTFESQRFLRQVRPRNSLAGDTIRRSSIVNPYAKREKDLFRGRRSSIRQEQLPSIQQQVSEDHHESWSSAFSKIKMVHTLADLSQILH